MKLDETAEKILRKSGVEEFYKNYGYYWVAGFTTGLSGTVTASIAKKDVESGINIEGSLKASLSYGVVKAEASGEGQYNKDNTNLSKNISITAEFSGQLGDEKASYD